jgi:hypothetical protein
MKVIAKLAGGSHLYGLNTPASDYDERYIYMYDDVSNIIGLDKNECVDIREEGEDSVGYEVRRFLNLLEKTNNQVIEFLYAPEDSFTILHPFFRTLMRNRDMLISQERFYLSLKGYIMSELKLANGERTGKLGGKRKEALNKYGFSPKNFVQLLRLAYCGKEFFDSGAYPVNIKLANPEFAERLIMIKTEPEKFTKEELNNEVKLAEGYLDKSYEFSTGRPLFTRYDRDFANQMLFDIYYPMLGKLYAQNNLCL